MPPYGRAGLYLELANLKDLVNEYRAVEGENAKSDLREAIFATCEKCGINSDVTAPFSQSELSTISINVFDDWIGKIRGCFTRTIVHHPNVSNAPSQRLRHLLLMDV